MNKRVLLCLLLLPDIGLADAPITVLHARWVLAQPGDLPRERQTVVVEQGRIARVADGYLVAADLGVHDAEIRIVDLTDAYLLPGLVDGHVHLATKPEPAGPEHGSPTEADLALLAARHAEIALQAGFTTVVDLGAVGIAGHENAIFAVRDAVRDGTLAGPRILAAGTPVAAVGQARAPATRPELAGLVDQRSLCNGADDCARAVRHQVKRGADIIVFFNTGSLLAAQPVAQAMTDAEMRAVVSTAHALGRKAIADGHHAAGIAAAVRAGADIVDSAHLYDDDTFALLARGVFLQSHIYGVVQAVGDDPDTLRAGLWGWLPEPILLRFQQIRRRPFVVIEAYRRGIRNIAYASDAGVYRWGENAGDLVEFVARGMSPQDAILTATVNAASMLGLAGEIGTIEPGKRADIIAVDSDPLRDISAMLRVTFVMRDGHVFRQNRRPTFQVTAR